jgi:uncharacterized protein YyaL (SSP411 family)
MVQEIHRHYLPNRVLIHAKPDGLLTRYNSIVKEIAINANNNAVYVCRNFTCGQPVTDIDQLRAML